MSWGSGPFPLLKWQIPFISCFQTCVLQRCLKFHFHHVIWAQCSHLSRFTMMPWRWWGNWGSRGLNWVSVLISWHSPTVGCWMCAAVHVKVNHFWGFLITVIEVIKKKKKQTINIFQVFRAMVICSKKEFPSGRAAAIAFTTWLNYANQILFPTVLCLHRTVQVNGDMIGIINLVFLVFGGDSPKKVVLFLVYYFDKEGTFKRPFFFFFF